MVYTDLYVFLKLFVIGYKNYITFYILLNYIILTNVCCVKTVQFNKFVTCTQRDGNNQIQVLNFAINI